MYRVMAQTRKRCPRCYRMVEAGELAVLTDDRRVTTRVPWFGRFEERGAWHLWHPECHASRHQADEGRR